MVVIAYEPLQKNTLVTFNNCLRPTYNIQLLSIKRYHLENVEAHILDIFILTNSYIFFIHSASRQ